MTSPRKLIFKRKSLRRLFSGLFINHRHNEGAVIADDWEIIEVHEQEISGTGEGDVAGDGSDSDVIELPDHLPFPMMHLPKSVKITILSKADVRHLLEDKITLVRSIHPNLSEAEAIILLQYFKWDVERTQDEWQVHEQKARLAVGLFEKPIVRSSESICGHCDETFPHDMMFSVSCGHQFCGSYWKEYIHEAISAGPRCLALQCPEPCCNAAVGPDMVEFFSSEKDKKKFENYLLKSVLIISCEGEVKWCPGPGCEYALLLSAGGDSNNSVTCRCLHRFCWKCINEAHSPVDCCTVDKWMSEMSIQSENWMLANTTACPNCNISMELNCCYQYFELCTNCKLEFCCKCGVDRSDHTYSKTSWTYECPLDKSSRHAKFHDERKKGIAKKSLERYNSYYQRWADFESCKANAQTDLKLFQEIQLPMICQMLATPTKEMDFLIEAQLKIVDCWQFLKWALVYAYFISEVEHKKMPLLEFMQDQAEKLVKQLNTYVEDVKHGVLQGEILSTCLKVFRTNLVQLTGVTRSYFDKMERALKDGLPEVVVVPTPSSRQMQMQRTMIRQEEPTDENVFSRPCPIPSPYMLD